MILTPYKNAGTVSNDTSYPVSGTSQAWTTPTNAQGAQDNTVALVSRTSVGPGQFILDTVKPIKGGNVVGTNRSDGSTPGSAAWKDISYDLTSAGWNIALTDADCRLSNFGMVLALISSLPTVITTNYLNAQNFGFGVSDLPSLATINTMSLGFYISLAGASFAPGTPVATPYGPKAIEKIKVGDQVLAYWRGKVIIATVRGLLKNFAEVMEVTMTDGTVLYPTPNHRFYVRGGWKKIGQLHVGETLWQRRDNLMVPVTIAKIDLTGLKSPVHNLEVAEVYNFFADGFLVHNGIAPTTTETDVDAFRIRFDYNEPGKKSPQLNQAVKRASFY